MDDPSANSQALPAGTRIEEFIIERVLGSGGFGITYLARDTGLNRQVVIKENLPAQFAWRETTTGTVRPRHTSGGDADDYQWSMNNFLREAETLASLDHPGIVRVLRKFEANGTAYFVMPFVDGVALDTLIEDRRMKGQPFSEEELRGLLDRLLAALGYLHDRGIYHRDIKPGNILISNDGVPALIDFGSARQRLSERSMTVVESAGYTPFEQLQSRGNVGPWSDLYALGATLVKVITGETPPKTNDRSFGDPWIPLLGRADTAGRFSDGFLSGIDRSLKLPIEDRWQSAGDWKEALGSGAVTPMKQSRTAPKPLAQESLNTPLPATKGKRWVWVAVALVILACGAWLATGSRGAPRPSGKDASGVLPGGLVITSEPSGALVKNSAGETLGETPAELKGLEAGAGWRGILELAGYLPAEVEAEVVSGETKLVPPVKLAPAAQKVVVTSDPLGAEVVEGGKVVGITPWESAPQEVGSIVALTLQKPGYDDTGLSGAVPFGKSLILLGTLKATLQKVVVTSEPPGADVVEDGFVVGSTPMKINKVSQATVAYRLRLEGFEELDVIGTVESGKSLILNGVLVPKKEDPKVTCERLLKNAVAGDRSAMWKVGRCYDEGLGVLRDDATAFLWYKKSAEAGDPEGMFLLGLCYELASVNPPSPREAKYWYEKAVRHGHESAMDRLMKKGLK